MNIGYPFNTLKELECHVCDILDTAPLMKIKGAFLKIMSKC